MTTPVRTCIGCRQTAARADLVRLVWNEASRAVVVDERKVLPGRGCHLHPGCAAIAIRRKAVGRALRRAIDPDQVAELLAGLATGGLA